MREGKVEEGRGEGRARKGKVQRGGASYGRKEVKNR